MSSKFSFRSIFSFFSPFADLTKAVFGCLCEATKDVQDAFSIRKRFAAERRWRSEHGEIPDTFCLAYRRGDCYLQKTY